MRYGSVCSGIEAASVAWHDLGWTPEWFSEIDPFPNAVLAHRFPDVPNLGDMNTLHQRKEFHDRPIDLLVGGTPCQSFSIAGFRRGLDDPRGDLALVFLRLAKMARPRWIVWENVPGVLSSNGGRDFGAFLGALAELGYGWAYRVLDAQYFGVPQCRRRIFVVGHLGDWRRAGAVLFEPACPRGDSSQGRKVRTTSTADADRRVARYLNQPHGVAVFQQNQRNEVRFVGGDGQLAGTLQAERGVKQRNFLLSRFPKKYIRKLTPREYERLQGFPDDWTLVPYGKNMANDPPRYRACGNSMAVPVMRWLGNRIAFVDNLTEQ